MSTRGFVGYMKGGRVRGFFNHWDSYCSGLGQDVIKVYNKYSWKQIKDFFLKNWEIITPEQFDFMIVHEKETNLKKSQYLKLEYGSKTKYEYNERAIFEMDWTKKIKWHEDDESFYKDAVFCEYSYIFDLDSPKKKLRVFTGFGKKPSKGALSGDFKDNQLPYFLMEAMTKYPVVKKALTCPAKMVLTYINYKTKDDDRNLTDLLKQVVEYRTKQPSVLVPKVPKRS
jgi:hypothetical protein